jgi:hypothetical protein
MRTVWARVVVGLVGAVFAIGVTGCSSGSSKPSAPAAAPSAAMSVPAESAPPQDITGKIAAENGSSWTVTGTDGKQYNVGITPQTRFGTKAAPGTPAQFPAGSTVHVSGAPTGYTFTATRITPTN